MNEKNPANQVIRPFAFLIKVASVTGTGKSGKVCGPSPSYAFFIIFLGGSIPQHSTEIEILSFVVDETIYITKHNSTTQTSTQIQINV